MSQAFELKQIKYQNLQKILQTSVASTRKILNCDRVIIYDASNLPQARVLAESLDSQHTTLLGQTIHDPFLEGDYLEMYCYGMSLTIDDICTSDISFNDIEYLEKLGIKSVAVAPICVEEQLLAFLVAHQCTQTQPWELQTVDFLAEQANKVGIAISSIAHTDTSKKFNFPQQLVEIHHRQQAQKVEATVNHQVLPHTPPKQQITLIQQTRERLFAILENSIIQGKKQESILDTIVIKTRQLLECDRVVIFRLNESNCGVVVAESVAAGWTKTFSQNQDLSQGAFKYSEEEYSGKVHTWNNTHDNVPDWYREQLEALNVNAGLIAPIANQGQLWGLLVAHHCSQARKWQEAEINWTTKIANHVGSMLDQTRNANGNHQPEKPPQLADVQQQLQKERMWTKYFANVIQNIRKSLTTEDILKTTVQQIHPILKCDRILVYALNHDSYGKIVAEAVSPGWTKAEGKVIQDPCFAARYLEKYRDGRFRAWNNIYESGMSDCYIEQLEQLQVKANLVVPIIKEQKLFGLLVAHQCSNPRQWEQSEILWLTQIATQVGFALDNAQLLADAQRLRQQTESARKWTEYFTDAVQQIRSSLKTKDVYQATVREVRRVLNCDRVLVYSLNQDRYGMIVAESVAHGWTRGEGRVIKDPCFEVRYLDQYLNGRVRAWHDIYESAMSGCYIEQLEQLEVKANLVVPIVNNGKLFGLLVAQQCSATRQWQQPEIDWLTQIATQVFFALDNAQMQEQIEQQAKTTQEILNCAVLSSSNIQRTVQNVIQGLQNLNQSCDSFSQTIQQVKNLSKELAQQSMAIAKAVNLGQVEVNESNSVVVLADKIFSLMQDLVEATANIDPFFNSIKTEITAKTTTLESETQTLVNGVNQFQIASQNLEQIVALNQEISNLIKQTSISLETQIQDSIYTQKSVQELTQIMKRVAQQSSAMMESFNQLGRIIG